MALEIAQIVERMYHAIERPTGYGNPHSAEGIALGLAAVLISQRDGVSLDVGFRRTFAWARMLNAFLMKAFTYQLKRLCLSDKRRSPR